MRRARPSSAVAILERRCLWWLIFATLSPRQYVWYYSEGDLFHTIRDQSVVAVPVAQAPRGPMGGIVDSYGTRELIS